MNRLDLPDRPANRPANRPADQPAADLAPARAVWVAGWPSEREDFALSEGQRLSL